MQAYCEDRFPSDFHMQEYCLNEQAEAGREFMEFVNAHRLDLNTVSADANGGNIAAIILVHCWDRFPDYHMRVYCMKEQETAARNLGKLR